MSKKAILVLDVINDLVHPDGCVGKQGFYTQATKHNILKKIQSVILIARRYQIPIYYVIVGFSQNYQEWSPQTKLFKEVKDKQQILLDSWATQIHDAVTPNESEIIITKHRIDAFYNTSLDLLLKVAGIEEVILTGISSDLVILATTFSAHDRDFKVTILEDCIASSDEHSHQCALHVIQKLAERSNSKKFISSRD